jgi:hypothetical protein
MRRGILVAATAALLVMGWSGSASAQAPCSAQLPPDEPTIWEYPNVACATDAGAVAASCVHHQDYGLLDQSHEFAECEATRGDGTQVAVAHCSEDRLGADYFTKTAQCDATAQGASAGCHRDTAFERASNDRPDTIECSATAGGAAATCTRSDSGTVYEPRTVTDDCTATAAGVSRSVHHDEGPDAPEVPDPFS